MDIVLSISYCPERASWYFPPPFLHILGHEPLQFCISIAGKSEISVEWLTYDISISLWYLWKRLELFYMKYPLIWCYLKLNSYHPNSSFIFIEQNIRFPVKMFIDTSIIFCQTCQFVEPKFWLYQLAIIIGFSIWT